MFTPVTSPVQNLSVADFLDFNFAGPSEEESKRMNDVLEPLKEAVGFLSCLSFDTNSHKTRKFNSIGPLFLNLKL